MGFADIPNKLIISLMNYNYTKTLNAQLQKYADLTLPIASLQTST